MRTIFAALVALTAAAQTNPEAKTADRVFRFQNTNTVQSFHEVTTLIRTITEAPRVTMDESEKSLELRGPAEEIALAQWIFDELDRPLSTDPKSIAAVHEYTLSGGNENVVRLFYLPNTKTVQMFQEVATLIRTTADIRRVFTYNAPRAMIIRGNGDQVALAAWLVEAIDQSSKTGSPAEYHMPADSDPRGDTVVHLFHIAHAASIQDFQEIATAIRMIADIRRVFTYNEPRLFVARGSAEQNVLAQWLVQQLDVPGGAGAASYEYQAPNITDNMVRVFYLHSPTVEQFQRTATDVRTKTGIRRLFTCSASRAMTLRGTVDQVAAADRMVKELDGSDSSKQ
ncbi:MAG: hypothetical protein LAO79_06695 [Acidobacteriia bacterium]|nr:hypothetical protein [Terriglobia bacterium]